ncbi:hypothetical protein HLH89_06335 [Rhizobium laguerreae]|uniref:hypothetical protein n=1 Tax=Rhizobium laguerreae TaxID=1076926 RepID=UPI0014786780|nr:hypothetical protein [Rhizobium laguerreae]NNH80647.1 hypothetical protein [Rhizobium laguerreae]
MNENETPVAMTAEEQQAVANKIVNTFARFSEAYDKYVDEMDQLVASMEYDVPLQKKSRSLILGLDDVALFMRDAKDVVDFQVRPFLRKL